MAERGGEERAAAAQDVGGETVEKNRSYNLGVFFFRNEIRSFSFVFTSIPFSFFFLYIKIKFNIKTTLLITIVVFVVLFISIELK